ncbi:hypothetical protein F5148DRAFT_987677, partial [Russula earlei]
KANFKMGECITWTHGQDGCSAITVDGGSEQSHVLLKPGWAFVQTRDWQVDIKAKGCKVSADNLGWVYTNDALLEPHALQWARGKLK